jgi:hypothetical protein
MKKETAEQLLLGVQLLSAVLVAGGNMGFALQSMSSLIQAKHAKGEELTLSDLRALLAETDDKIAEQLARAQAALASQGA